MYQILELYLKLIRSLTSVAFNISLVSLGVTSNVLYISMTCRLIPTMLTLFKIRLLLMRLICAIFRVSFILSLPIRTSVLAVFA